MVDVRDKGTLNKFPVPVVKPYVIEKMLTSTRKRDERVNQFNR